MPHKQEAMRLKYAMSFAYNIWGLGQAVAGFLARIGPNMHFATPASNCSNCPSDFYVGSSKMRLLSGWTLCSR
ncbi:hypothetical protein BofuT4_uP135460.1 [Botrytis cinerea T4]|uniref:Uncharacterized protein n=1 Tax=Botryotinia fuckeliana (strain T4) TaxID=999810 RepID=G2YPF3_BOTF4|nr:hypothetical protein BofuT4_uP135460.1 [Botrytis cinerea T4]